MGVMSTALAVITIAHLHSYLESIGLRWGSKGTCWGLAIVTVLYTVIAAFLLSRWV